MRRLAIIKWEEVGHHQKRGGRPSSNDSRWTKKEKEKWTMIKRDKVAHHQWQHGSQRWLQTLAIEGSRGLSNTIIQNYISKDFFFASRRENNEVL